MTQPNPKDWFVAEYTRRWEADMEQTRRDNASIRRVMWLCNVGLLMWAVAMVWILWWLL